MSPRRNALNVNSSANVNKNLEKTKNSRFLSKNEAKAECLTV